MDGIYQVIRLFNEIEVVHTEGEVDPLRDMEVIYQEIIQKDLEIVKNRIEELEKSLKRKKERRVEEDRDVLIKVLKLL